RPISVSMSATFTSIRCSGPDITPTFGVAPFFFAANVSNLMAFLLRREADVVDDLAPAADVAPDHRREFLRRRGEGFVAALLDRRLYRGIRERLDERGVDPPGDIRRQPGRTEPAQPTHEVDALDALFGQSG